jgi:hypothetical protein
MPRNDESTHLDYDSLTAVTGGANKSAGPRPGPCRVIDHDDEGYPIQVGDCSKGPAQDWVAPLQPDR